MKYRIATTDGEPSLHDFDGELAWIEADLFDEAFAEWRMDLLEIANNDAGKDGENALETIHDAFNSAYDTDWDKCYRATVMMIASDDESTREKYRAQLLEEMMPHLQKRYMAFRAQQQKDADEEVGYEKYLSRQLY